MNPNPPNPNPKFSGPNPNPPNPNPKFSGPNPDRIRKFRDRIQTESGNFGTKSRPNPEISGPNLIRIQNFFDRIQIHGLRFGQIQIQGWQIQLLKIFQNRNTPKSNPRLANPNP